MLDIQTLQPADVLHAYSGKAGKCYCGCSGKHYANPARLAEAAAARGYEYSDDEVSGQMIVKILRLVQAHHDPSDPSMRHEAEPGDKGQSHFTAEVGKRTYTVYLGKRTS